MELPHLGEHCSDPSCNLLDFLPIKCDGCKKVFCLDHFTYSAHSCSAAQRDVQVPVCPLCNSPVSGFKPGDPPDIAVSQHIDNMCKNSSKKVYTNRCNARQCKKKEMIRIECDQCSLNFCLKHRHPADHDCRPPAAHAQQPQRTRAQQQAARAALERQMREDEQLARALQASMNDNASASSSAPARNVGSNNRRQQPSVAQNTHAAQPSCAIS